MMPWESQFALRKRPRPLAPPRSGPSMAMVGCLAVAGLALAGCGTRSFEAQTAFDEGAESAAAPAPDYGGAVESRLSFEAQAGNAGAGEGSSNVAAEPAGSEVAASERKLVFTGAMDLRVTDPITRAEEITRWVEDRDGFVESSSASESGQGPSVYMSVRVPTVQFDALRAFLRAGADDVLRDEKQRTDVTARYADLNARLANLEAAEKELREMLDQARERGGTTEDVLAVHAETTRLQGDIDSLRAQRDTLAEEVALSTLAVSLEPVEAVGADVGARWRPGATLRGALRDLQGGLRNLADFAIYFGVAVLPILSLFGLILWVLWRALRALRRRMPAGVRRQRAPATAGTESAKGDQAK